MRIFTPLIMGSLAPVALTASHYLFTGNLYAPAAIHLLQFDDEAKTLKLVDTFAADSPHNWITMDHNRKNIYGTSLSASRLASYDVSTPTAPKASKAMAQTGVCAGKNPNYVEALQTAPYYVFSATWPGPSACGAAYAVTANGSLDRAVDMWSYAQESGAHGLALGERAGQLVLYTADLNGDSVWAHAIDRATGKAKEMGRLKMAKAGVHPRHVAAHPKGLYVYLVMEGENTIHQIELDAKTGVAAKDIKTFSVLPDGDQASGYSAASLSLAPSGRYLWAIARGRSTTNRSQVSCFLLAEDGAIVKRMFVTATTATGSGSNAVTPAFWDEEYAVVAEARSGSVEVMKLAGKKTGESGAEYTTADVVARLKVNDGGCCANAVWHS